MDLSSISKFLAPRDQQESNIYARHIHSLRYFLLSGSSGFEPPRNSRFPSLKVMFDPFATFSPFFARYPSTVTSVPGSSDSFVKPRRNRILGLPPSIIHVTSLPS